VYTHPTRTKCSLDCAYKEVCVLQASVAERVTLKPEGVVWVKENELWGECVAKCATHVDKKGATSDQCCTMNAPG